MTLLTYYPGDSFLHRMDPRVKIAAGILTSLILFKTSSQAGNLKDLSSWIIACGLILAPTALLLLKKALPISVIFRYLRVFAPLLVVIIASSLLGEDKRESFLTAAAFSLRLVLALTAAALFVSVTSVSAIKKTVVWVLGPFRCIPAHRFGLMIALSITTVPRLLKTADDIRDALKSRCVTNRKNPVTRIKLFAVPMLIAVSRQVEELAQAMEARCFSEKRKEAPFSLNTTDIVWLALHAAAAAAALSLDFFSIF